MESLLERSALLLMPKKIASCSTFFDDFLHDKSTIIAIGVGIPGIAFKQSSPYSP